MKFTIIRKREAGNPLTGKQINFTSSSIINLLFFFYNNWSDKLKSQNFLKANILIACFVLITVWDRHKLFTIVYKTQENRDAIHRSNPQMISLIMDRKILYHGLSTIKLSLIMQSQIALAVLTSAVSTHFNKKQKRRKTNMLSRLICCTWIEFHIVKSQTWLVDVVVFSEQILLEL